MAGTNAVATHSAAAAVLSCLRVMDVNVTIPAELDVNAYTINEDGRKPTVTWCTELPGGVHETPR